MRFKSEVFIPTIFALGFAGCTTVTPPEQPIILAGPASYTSGQTYDRDTVHSFTLPTSVGESPIEMDFVYPFGTCVDGTRPETTLARVTQDGGLGDTIINMTDQRQSFAPQETFNPDQIIFFPGCVGDYFQYSAGMWPESAVVTLGKGTGTRGELQLIRESSIGSTD